MKMTHEVGMAFIIGFAGYFVGSRIASMDSKGADTIQTTDPFQQAEFDSLPPMPNAQEVVDNMMLREDTNEALLAQNAPMVAPPELNMVNLLAAIKGANNLPTPSTVTL
jgi:CheY-specific phosphatase CheX